jgi:hypothetical protein
LNLHIFKIGDMLIPLHNIKHAYQQILKEALECEGLGCTIYIFVSNDVDSLTSFKILSVSIQLLIVHILVNLSSTLPMGHQHVFSTFVNPFSHFFIVQNLFKSDEVQFVSIPVFSQTHIRTELNKLKDSQYIRSFVFINCGGYLDLTRQWFYDNDNIKSYLFDCHRPYNHNNINETKKVHIFHDGCRSFNECPTAEDDRVYQAILENEDPDQDSDEYDSEYSDL